MKKNRINLHEIVKIFNLGAGIRQIPEGPETVLDQSLAGVTQVHCQRLHA
jgi:hypothetical protein